MSDPSNMSITSKWDSVTTLVCSALSLVGSIIVLCSYMVAQSTATPRAAELIRNLAIADFFWFCAAFTQSVYWNFTDQEVPAELCYFMSPLVNFMRMASLIWTCTISFDVLMSVNKRKWLWVSESATWIYYRRIYFIVVLVFALPGTVLNIIKQHANSGNEDLGCNAGYEKIGEWYDVFFTELLPISIGFLANVYVYAQVREKMSQKAFPQSVRKRRRRIMYHYVIVCIICWTPTMVFYLSEISNLHSPALEIIARSSLYLTGFFNFLVFGMQDPHLKRSFGMMTQKMGCYCCSWWLIGVKENTSLKTTEIDKTVMFGGHIEDNADIAKDKKNIYRYHKLTKEDKQELYQDRPDLDPNANMPKSKKEPHTNTRIKNRSIDFTAVKGMQSSDPWEDSDDSNLERSLLSADERKRLYDEGNAFLKQDKYDEEANSHNMHNAEKIPSADSPSFNLLEEGSTELMKSPMTSPYNGKVKELNTSKPKPKESRSFVSFNTEDVIVTGGREDRPGSDVLISEVINPANSRIQFNTEGFGIQNPRTSSEERVALARQRMKQTRAETDGPVVSDEEALLARTRVEADNVRDSIGNSAIMGAHTLSRSSTQNSYHDPDSSGDEADEEDHALYESLEPPGSASSYVRSP